MTPATARSSAWANWHWSDDVCACAADHQAERWERAAVCRPALKDGAKPPRSPVNRAGLVGLPPRRGIASRQPGSPGFDKGVAPSFRAGRSHASCFTPLPQTTCDYEREALSEVTWQGGP
jgi:hypothetical protein